MSSAFELEQMADYPEDHRVAVEIYDVAVLARDDSFYRLLEGASALEYTPTLGEFQSEAVRYVEDPGLHCFVAYDEEGRAMGFQFVFGPNGDPFGSTMLVFAYADPESETARSELAHALLAWMQSENIDHVQCVTRADVPDDVYFDTWCAEMNTDFNHRRMGSVLRWDRKAG